MASELIQWPKAKYWEKAWNPIIGCKPCSPACENCYAAAMTKRFGGSFEPHQSSRHRPPRSGVVFCGNLTDLFGEWNTLHTASNFIWDTVSKRGYEKAIYLWLTKRPLLMGYTLTGRVFVQNHVTFLDLINLSNHYFGFTAENQEWYYKRIDIWRNVVSDNVNRWLSAEPILGQIDLGLQYIAPEDMPFEWVVVGCESGPHRRPCKVEWVESIVEQCRKAGVPVFVKQLCLPNGKFTNKIGEFPEHLRIRQVPWAGKGAAK